MTDENITKKLKTDAEKGKAIAINQDKDWYKDLTIVAQHLYYYMGEFENQQELINRLLDENFKLNGKIETLKKHNE